LLNSSPFDNNKKMEKTKINYSDLSYWEKLACISLFPNEAKKTKVGLLE